MLIANVSEHLPLNLLVVSVVWDIGPKPVMCFTSFSQSGLLTIEVGLYLLAKRLLSY